MTKRILIGVSTLVVVSVLLATGVVAQQPPAQGAGARAGGAGQGRQGGRGPGGAPPPLNWPAPALPDGPIAAQSAMPQHRDLRITVTKGLSHPWAMAFLPDGGILVTERAGRMRLIRNGVLQSEPIAGVPAVAAGGLNGLLDVALHPQFAKNRWVYFTYHKPVGAPPAAAAAAPAEKEEAKPAA